MKQTMQLALALTVAFTTTRGFALERLTGEYQLNGNKYGFTVDVEKQSFARLYWNDGTPGVLGYYNPNPQPAPRCPCDVYQNGTRRILVEFDLKTGYGTQVHYDRVPRLPQP